jgi:hypothetical protein
MGDKGDYSMEELLQFGWDIELQLPVSIKQLICEVKQPYKKKRTACHRTNFKWNKEHMSYLVKQYNIYKFVGRYDNDKYRINIMIDILNSMTTNHQVVTKKVIMTWFSNRRTTESKH